jgi:hypothetical protein
MKRLHSKRRQGAIGRFDPDPDKEEVVDISAVTLESGALEQRYVSYTMTRHQENPAPEPIHTPVLNVPIVNILPEEKGNAQTKRKQVSSRLFKKSVFYTLQFIRVLQS